MWWNHRDRHVDTDAVHDKLDKHGVLVDTIIKVLDDDEKDGYVIYETWCPDSNKEIRA